MPTNPYYQRAFNAIGGTLARARAVVTEYQLIQRGFDLIGEIRGATKYQLSCSDLFSDLSVNPTAGYFRCQRSYLVSGVRASLRQASSSGNVVVAVTVNGVAFCDITINAGLKTSVTSTPQPNFTEGFVIPDDAEVVFGITSPGSGAQGLICSVIGTITTAV